ncbi:MAG: zinc metallopeptidase [Candidatus Sumerlaeia bacterium]|nr:zinc metallopeptidase [Candidatus Sumerlaeia bacterium]
MFGYFDPLYLVLVGPALLLALYAQIKVSGSFAKYKRVAASSGLSGAEAAYEMLRAAGLADRVGIELHEGFLSDHYDPRQRVLRLSPDVYHGRSLAALGVACHEAGHAIQHAAGYAPLALRNAIVPVAGFGSYAAIPMIILGAALQWFNLALLGLLLFAGLVAFQVINLPVEFNASSRAKSALREMGLISGPAEYRAVSSVLSAAAMTYVAATIAAAVQLLYYAIRLGLIGGRDE